MSPYSPAILQQTLDEATVEHFIDGTYALWHPKYPDAIGTGGTLEIARDNLSHEIVVLLNKENHEKYK